jgi:oligopeptide/dipeptide ABC transporter ATP-binding protein
MTDVWSWCDNSTVPAALEARGVTVEVGPAHARSRVVRDVSVVLLAGQITALVGETGSGKTMTALSLLRLLPPGAKATAQTMLLGGTDLAALSEAQMAAVRGSRISMIFQDPLAALNPVRTVGFQIAEPLRAHRGMSAAAAARRSVELLDQVGIPDPEHNVKRYPHELSGGMRQRVLIAAALACDPDVLVADEPTTALDVTIQAQILGLLRSETERRGLAVLLVTHDLAVAWTVADRVQVMYGGTTVEEGRSREVIGAPNHPYTRGLLASVPSTKRKVTPLLGIPGSPDGVWSIAAGCRFAPRCAHVVDRCRQDEPPLLPIAGDHDSRCWVYAQ